jgi:hypothetical protein
MAVMLLQVALLNHWLVERHGAAHPIAGQLALLQQDLQAWRSRLEAGLMLASPASPAHPGSVRPSSPSTLTADTASLPAMHSPRTPHQQSPLPSSPRMTSAPELHLPQPLAQQLLSPIQSGGLLRSRSSSACSPRGSGGLVLPPVLEGSESDSSLGGPSENVIDATATVSRVNSSSNSAPGCGGRDTSILAAFGSLRLRGSSAGKQATARSESPELQEMQPPPAELPAESSEGQVQQGGFALPKLPDWLSPRSRAGSTEASAVSPRSPYSHSPGSSGSWCSPSSNSPGEYCAYTSPLYGTSGRLSASANGSSAAGGVQAFSPPVAAAGASPGSGASPSSADKKRGFMLALKQTLHENMQQLGGRRASPGRLSKDVGRVDAQQLAAEAMQKAVQRGFGK